MVAARSTRFEVPTMFCRFCGLSIPDGSRFCNLCGKPLGEAGDATPPPLPAPAGAAAPAAKPGDARPPEIVPKSGATRFPSPPENEIWAGAISPRSMFGSFVVSGVWCIAVLLAVLFVSRLRVRPIVFIALSVSVLPFCYVYFVWLYEKIRVRYRLTTMRLFKREGVLFRRSSEIELVRVDDVSVEQTLMDRLFNTGTIVVNSTDASDPVLRIDSVDKPHDVKEMIRNATLQRRRGVTFVERI
jgi:membrane protein YdbS with pleckstrin-like domain